MLKVIVVVLVPPAVVGVGVSSFIDFILLVCFLSM